MRSSTSSSEHAAEPVVTPERRLGKPLLLALTLALAVLAGYEGFWRAKGFTPALRDTPERWAQLRLAASAAGSRSIAIVGASRFHLGVDPAVLAQEFPGFQPFQLAIDGFPALPILRDLAEDPQFEGTVLFDVTPTSFFAPLSEVLVGRSVEWAAYAQHRPYVAGMEGTLKGMLQRRLAMLHPSLEARELVERLAKGKGIPTPPYARLREDRFHEADYSRVDTRALIDHWTRGFSTHSRPPTDAQLSELLSAVSQWVTKIRSRGGQVVFVRMISSGAVYDLEERIRPRPQTWDRMVNDLNVRAIHFADVPALARLKCPEGSHLDAKAAVEFTQGLARELKRRGWLPETAEGLQSAAAAGRL